MEAVWRERHGCDPRGHVLAAQLDEDRGAGLREGALDIAHGDRPADRRPETARGDLSDDLSGFVLDHRALADRSSAVRQQADAQAGRALPKLAPDPLLARKAAGL